MAEVGVVRPDSPPALLLKMRPTFLSSANVSLSRLCIACIFAGSSSALCHASSSSAAVLHGASRAQASLITGTLDLLTCHSCFILYAAYTHIDPDHTTRSRTDPADICI